MSDNTELIAEAKNYEGDNGTARWPALIRELADALEAAEQKHARIMVLIENLQRDNKNLANDRAALQVVIERCAKLPAAQQSWIDAGRSDQAISREAVRDHILGLLAQSPTDALEAVKAAAWDEAIEAQRLEAPAHEADLPVNPYAAIVSAPSTPEQPEGENR